MEKRFTRREILKVMGAIAGAAAGGVFNGCAPKPTPAPEATKAVEPTAIKAVEPTATKAVEPTKEVKKEEPTTAPVAEEKCEQDWNTRFPPVPKKYDPPVQIEIEFERFPEYPEGDSPTNHPKYNWIKENMGIEHTVHWHADRDSPVFTQKRKADIAAGSLADRLGTGGTELADFIKNDAVEEIRDIWEATASPLTKERRKYPDGKVWIPVWRGDKLYGIPFQWGCDGNVDSLGWVRKDWLDKVGLPVPDTVDDVDKTLRAWKEQGICEFGLNAANSPFTWNHRLDVFFGAFGHMPKCWRDFGDGKLVYDGLDPENKKALALLRGWYEEGFMHPDFFTYQPWAANDVFNEQKTGLTYCPWWMAGTMVDLEQTVEGCQVVNCMAPEGPTGLRHRWTAETVGMAIVYRKGLDPIKIEATINELNWMMEAHINGPEKYDLYGDSMCLEGYDWEWTEDCELMAGKYPTNTLNRSIGWNFDFLSYPDITLDAHAPLLKWAGMDPAKLNKYQRYLISDPKSVRSMKSYKMVCDTRDLNIGTEWFGVPTDRMVKIGPDMPNEDQVYIGIITGTMQMDAWDQWVEEWHKFGGDEMAEDINAWYETIK